jgi:two-component system chemotaxis response regulator CheY
MSWSNEVTATLAPGTHALVIDDSAATRRIFRSLLEPLGLTVLEAGDGRAALDLLEQDPHAAKLVFCDISMPRMDGFEFCARLHQAAWYDGSPVVMVSTQSDAPSVVRALKLGADDYIPKPFDRELLARVIARVLHHD